MASGHNAEPQEAGVSCVLELVPLSQIPQTSAESRLLQRQFYISLSNVHSLYLLFCFDHSDQNFWYGVDTLALFLVLEEIYPPM